MPNARSLRRVALSWLLRAWAFLFCARAISFAACSYSGLEARPSSHQDPTTAAALVVIQADFPLLIFETPLDPPTGKGHPQERAKPGVGGSVAEEVLDLVAIGHVAGDDQVVRLVGKALFVLGVDQRMLHFPDHGAFLGILLLPRANHPASFSCVSTASSLPSGSSLRWGWSWV